MSIRAPFFEIEFSNLTSNAKTGFMYNPHYTSYEALQLRTGIHDAKVRGTSITIKVSSKFIFL